MKSYFSDEDRSAWGPGPWENEPDRMLWTDPRTKLECALMRNHSGTLCGYVGIFPGHKAFGVGYDDIYEMFDVSAHGGLTFADHGYIRPDTDLLGLEPVELWWVGFDCAHSGDLCPGMNAVLKGLPGGTGLHRSGDIYRDIDYVINEICDLADRITQQGPILALQDFEEIE